MQGANGGGGIQMVELIEANGTNHKVWFGDDVGSDDGSGDFVLRFPLTGYEVKSARIWTSGSIDAVQLMTEDTWTYTLTGSDITKQENNHTGETWTYAYTSGQLTHVEKRTTDGGDLELEADYVYDGSGNETERTIWTPDAKNHVVRHDGYSVATITDPFDDMIVLDEINYDQSGNVISRTNDEFDGTYKWSTRDRDAEINLLVNTANYLDTGTGRWVAVGSPKGHDAGDSVVVRYVTNKPQVAVNLSAFVAQTDEDQKKVSAAFEVFKKSAAAMKEFKAAEAIVGGEIKVVADLKILNASWFPNLRTIKINPQLEGICPG